MIETVLFNTTKYNPNFHLARYITKFNEIRWCLHNQDSIIIFKDQIGRRRIYRNLNKISKRYLRNKKINIISDRKYIVLQYNRKRYIKSQHQKKSKIIYYKKDINSLTQSMKSLNLGKNKQTFLNIDELKDKMKELSILDK